MAYKPRIPEGRHVDQSSIGVFARMARLTGRAAAWRLHRMLAGSLPDRPFRVLDIGTGPGSIPAHLNHFWPKAQIVGLDVCPRMLGEAAKTKAKRGADVQLLAGNGLQLPFATGAFDLVLCLFTLHHINRPGAFLSETARVLAPEGLLLVLDFRRDMSRLRFCLFNLLWQAFFCLSPGRKGFSESVHSAWRPSEIEVLADGLPLDHLTVLSSRTELMITNRPEEAQP